MSRKKQRLSTSGGDELGFNPFGKLDAGGLPENASNPQPQAAASKPVPAKKNRGRVDVKREKAGRGGKTVTVVYGMANIEMRERESLLKKMKATCGSGGTIKDGNLEIQGDKRDKVSAVLEDAGFRVVLAGG